MTNMYVLATGNLPSPWARVATYDGRYVRFTSSTGSHGVTGGASQHNHPSAATESGPSNNTSYGGSPGTYCMKSHTHTIASATSGSSNNDPLYYSYALWRIDLGIWDANYRNFPAEATVLAKSTISCLGMDRFSSGDGRLIKLGSPGTSGGRSVHTDHSISVTLASMTPDGGGDEYSASIGAPRTTHGHTATLPSVASNSIIPAYIQLRLYRVTSETDRAPQNIICFFDGTPNSNWTQLGLGDSMFPMGSDSDPTTGGADSHGHSGTECTSTDYKTSSAVRAHYTYVYNSLQTHHHSVTITLNSASHVPQYVSLCPYYLNTTLYPITGGGPLMW